jgi:hypothetical protein
LVGKAGEAVDDQIVTLEVSLPKAHSSKAEALYQQLSECKSKFNPRYVFERNSEIVVIESQHEHALFTLKEVCERCGTHLDIIVEMIEYGIVEPVEPAVQIEPSSECTWYFDSHFLVRLQQS